jgi:hypothetical protein
MKRIAVSLVGVYIEATNDPPADRHVRERKISPCDFSGLRRAAMDHALRPAVTQEDEQNAIQPDDDRDREPRTLGERARLLDRDQQRAELAGAGEPCTALVLCRRCGTEARVRAPARWERPVSWPTSYCF